MFAKLIQPDARLEIHALAEDLSIRCMSPKEFGPGVAVATGAQKEELQKIVAKVVFDVMSLIFNPYRNVSV